MSNTIYIVKGTEAKEPICQECGYPVNDEYCYEFGEWCFYCPKCFYRRFRQNRRLAFVCDCCGKVDGDFCDLGDEILCEDCCDEAYKREIVEAYANAN